MSSLRENYHIAVAPTTAVPSLARLKTSLRRRRSLNAYERFRLRLRCPGALPRDVPASKRPSLRSPRPSVTLNKERAAIGSPLQDHLQVRAAARTHLRRRLLGLRPRHGSGRGEALAGRPPAADADVDTGSRASRSSTPGRSSFRTIRTSARRSSGSVSTTRRPASACRSDATEDIRGRNTWSKAQPAAAVREHLPDLPGRAGTPPEIDPNDPTSEWQWTKQNATVVVPQPEEGRHLLPRVRRAARSLQPAAAGRP